ADKNKKISDCTCKSPYCTCFDDCSSGPTCNSVKTTDKCNRCKPFPCPNTNYTCTPYLNGYNFDCSAGYTGYSCEYLTGGHCFS
ncbi:hypothetical protein PENTCL1PPCAC_16546, partial [Pristionchus entomophagus]